MHNCTKLISFFVYSIQMLLNKQVDRIYIEILFIFCMSSVIKCYSVPCTFNTMCMCWIQDDEDFTKMDINCIGIPFARFPGRFIIFYKLNFTESSRLKVIEMDKATGTDYNYNYNYFTYNEAIIVSFDSLKTMKVQNKRKISVIKITLHRSHCLLFLLTKKLFNINERKKFFRPIFIF